MNKQPQITNQTKANLQEAFWSLYTQKPIEKISIREITDLAGYNRGTFYLYYRDVYDIFDAIKDDLIDKLTFVIQDTMQHNETFDLSQQMEFLVTLFQTHSKYAKVLLGDHGDPQFSSRIKEIIWPILNRYFVPSAGHSEYEMKLLAEFYLSGTLAVVSRWLQDPQMPLEEMIHFMVTETVSRAPSKKAGPL